jgi:hypothetical protein
LRGSELAISETGRALAAWVPADLTVERLEQTYTRLDERRYDYASHYDASAPFSSMAPTG